MLVKVDVALQPTSPKRKWRRNFEDREIHYSVQKWGEMWAGTLLPHHYSILSPLLGAGLLLLCEKGIWVYIPTVTKSVETASDLSRSTQPSIFNTLRATLNLTDSRLLPGPTSNKFFYGITVVENVKKKFKKSCIFYDIRFIVVNLNQNGTIFYKLYLNIDLSLKNTKV